MVHCVELVPGQGAKLGRSAGNECQVMARDGGTVTLKLPSGEVRVFDGRCLATVGTVGNGEWESVKLGKAGRKRLLGIRPTVRGVAMNPVDHPMGGGEGRTSGGGQPRSPWGQLAKGGKTRKPNKASNKVIVKRRK
jgi:large subunit ribosomal protein L2